MICMLHPSVYVGNSSPVKGELLEEDQAKGSVLTNGIKQRA